MQMPYPVRESAGEGREPELESGRMEKEMRGGREKENMAASIPLLSQLRAHSLLRVRPQSTIYSLAQEDHFWVP